ncbi:MAG: ketoacyl-ACP synthase III [Gammaproteobacteria bacterium]|nr:ketoacyl-ACP synthase III [Gammaproteobacteria bacterium]
MNNLSYARIVGTGSFSPKKILTNKDLEKIVDTSDEWITERSGIKQRHILSENEVLGDMVYDAAVNAIDAAAIDRSQIDLIIVASATNEYSFPSAACILQNRLGIKNIPAFDINAGCTGFIYQLNIANQYIQNGSAKCVLLVAAEALSKVTDWTDRGTCVLFGDGAGAAVLVADTKPGIRSVTIGADGSYKDLLYAKDAMYVEKKDALVHMAGSEVFKVAVKKLGEIANHSLEINNLPIEKLDWLIPHQANMRIIQATAKRINLPMERVIVTIQDQGNTSASSVPLALDTAIRDGRIKRGQTLLMEAFGAGFTWGSALVDY